MMTMMVLSRAGATNQRADRSVQSGPSASGALRNEFIKPLRSRQENPLQLARTFSPKQEARSTALIVQNKAGWSKAPSAKKGESKNFQKTKAVAVRGVMTPPVCNLDSSIDEEPHPYCRLNHEDALRLAQSAIDGTHFPDRAELMSKVRTPWDILTADRAIVAALEAANQGADAKQIKQNNMRALFLRDNVGQCVINQAMKTWHGKRVMAAYVLKVLPTEMFPTIPEVRNLSGDGKLSRAVARQLADNVIAGKPLKAQHHLIKQVIGFKDLVMLEEEAIRSLVQVLAKTPQPKARAEYAMNFLFLLHEVGTQTAHRIMTERADRVAYMKHMVKSLFVL